MKNLCHHLKCSWYGFCTRLCLLLIFPIMIMGCSGNRLLPEKHTYLDNGIVFHLPENWKADIEDEDWVLRVMVGSTWAEIEFLSGNLNTMPSGVMGFIKLENVYLDEIDENPERIPVMYLSEGGFIADLAYDEELQNLRNLEFTDIEINGYTAAKRVETGTLQFWDNRSHDVVITEAAFLSEDVLVDMLFIVQGIEYESQKEFIDAIIESLRLDNEAINSQANFRGVSNAFELLGTVRDNDLEEAKNFVCTDKYDKIETLFTDLNHADGFGYSCNAEDDTIRCNLYWGEDLEGKQDVIFERKNNLVCGWQVP